MNTRRAESEGPLNQHRYMSSPEYAELHGLSGIAVAAKAAIMQTTAKSEFLWFLQAQSLAEGGLKKIARDLLATFPERLGTATMHRLGAKPGKVYSAKDADAIRWELGDVSAADFCAATGTHCASSDDDQKPRSAESLLDHCRQLALADDDGRRPTPVCIERMILDLCVNPALPVIFPGESDAPAPRSPHATEVPYFHDLPGALIEYKARWEARARETFCQTAISRKIWETLDFAHKSRGMVLLDGLEGRGKTEAVKAWCQMHLGCARFVSLKGVTSKTTAFREMAKALGIASSYTRKASEMQQRIEDVLERSRLMLVIDEAHFAFNQGQRIYSRPELIDWIVTAICNRGIPVALVTTPQFLHCVERAAVQVEWNYRQFRRRVKRYVKLPAENTGADLESVARRVFPKADKNSIDYILGYVDLSKRDISALGDVADELRIQICPDAPHSVDLSKQAISFAQAKRAIKDQLMPSDTAFAEGLAAVKARPGKTRRIAHAPAPAAIMDDSEGQGAQSDEGARNGLAPRLQAPRIRLDDTMEVVP